MIGFSHVILFFAFGENLEFYVNFPVKGLLNGRRAALMAAEMVFFVRLVVCL